MLTGPADALDELDGVRELGGGRAVKGGREGGREGREGREGRVSKVSGIRWRRSGRGLDIERKAAHIGKKVETYVCD